MATIHHDSALLDLHPSINDDVHAMVMAGLHASPKRLPCKLLYDERGSELFEQICELPEYYPTPIELSIIRNHVDEMAEAIGPDVLLIEFGSGAGAKCRLLLDALDRPAGYVPIGNFEPDAARQFLTQSRTLVGQSGGMLLGVDLRKDVDVLRAAYNDEQGVTAAFNLNLLHRVNRELGADFEPDHFTHEARWNEELDRIEMHLVSARRQDVCVNGTTVSFDAGESIHTENSYKRTPEQFERIVHGAGWRTARTWTDPRNWFSVQYLSATESAVPSDFVSVLRNMARENNDDNQNSDD